jgi:anti-sigma B factor antagonist
MPTQLADAHLKIEGDTAVIALSGDINGAAEPVLAGAYAQAAATGVKSVVLNFASTDFINSTGIAVIVGILAKARQEERTISACGLTDHYKHIFEITRLADFMPVFPDEGSALANLS